MGEIQTRFGSASLHTAADSIQAGENLADGFASAPTGISELDAITSVGGFPLGRLSLCLGPSGSGKMLVGYHLMARASQDSAAVLMLDLRRHADPWLLAQLGARLDRLLVLRPPARLATGKQLQVALEGALALVRAGAGCVVADLPPKAGASGLWDPYAAALTSVCAQASVPLLALSESAAEPLRYAASLVLRLERREWLTRHGDIDGVRLCATVEKNKLGPPGLSAEFCLAYPRATFLASGWPRPHSASDATETAAIADSSALNLRVLA